MDANTDIDELINRFLDAEASEEEVRRLDEWLAEDKSRVQYFLYCKNLHDLCHPAFSPSQIDTDKALKRVMHFTADNGRRLFLRRITVAAAILLCAGVSVLLFYSSRHNIVDESVQMVQEANPLPGQPAGITLTLASGKKVDLSKPEALRVATAENSVVHVDGRALQYESKHSGAEEDVVYHVLNVPRGKEYFLTLSDGTKMWVNAETEIKYPVKFPAGERQIFVRGEAYLEVTHDKDAPFTVVMPQNEVTVLGTSFNVKAYPGESQQHVTLVSGKVKVASLDDKQAMTLRPGEQAVLNMASGKFEKQKVNTDLYCSWHLGSLVFLNNTLEEILGLLSRRYDMQLRWDDEALKQIRFSGEITKEDHIEKILKLVEYTGDVKFVVTDDHIRIMQP